MMMIMTTTNRYDSIDDLPDHLKEQARAKLGEQITKAENKKTRGPIMAPESPSMKRTHKYGAQRTWIDGIVFDSKGEALRYKELKTQEKIGEISDLQIQPVFELQPRFKKNGKTIRAIKYIADFSYTRDGVQVVEDFKGVETTDFKIKKKLFEYRYQDKELDIVKRRK